MQRKEKEGGKEEDGSVQCYLTQKKKKKMKLKVGRELLKKEKKGL